MSRTVCRVALLAALLTRGIAAADVLPFIESPTVQKPGTRAGIAVDADGILLKAVVVVRAQDQATQLVPRISSSLPLTNRVGLDTKIELTDWNAAAGPAGTNVDTTVHFDPAAPFADRVEAKFWRAPDGQTGQRVQLGFHKKLRTTPGVAPLTVRSHATLETTTGGLIPIGDATVLDPRLDTRRMGLETELTGILPNLPPGRSTVRIKMEKLAGARTATTQSIGYTQNWALRYFGRLGMNVKMLRDSLDAANELQPSIRFTLSGEF
ncbi:MAG: hypothetical protein ABI640_10135 [Gammaproteobacteria bacterium]